MGLIHIHGKYHDPTSVTVLGMAYCWGVPRGIVLGFGDVGEGIEGGRLSTRVFRAEWSVGEIGR